MFTTLIAATTMITGTWRHVAGVFDDSQMRIYLNGVLDGTLSTTNAPASGTSSVRIGKTTVGSYFGGLIDEARVSNSAVYTSNFTPQTSLTTSSSTKALWKFDSQNVSDASGNGNTGTWDFLRHRPPEFEPAVGGGLRNVTKAAPAAPGLSQYHPAVSPWCLRYLTAH